MEIDKCLKNRLKRPKKRNRKGWRRGEINNVSNKKKEFEIILNFMRIGKIEKLTCKKY